MNKFIEMYTYKDLANKVLVNPDHIDYFEELEANLLGVRTNVNYLFYVGTVQDLLNKIYGSENV